MRKADQYYYQTLQMLDIEGTWDEEPRAKWEDGEPANAKFITQVSEVYDISRGEFPMPTLRNTAVKTGIKEIFWIYQKQSNKLSDAHDLGITWWDNWEVDGTGTIGIRYGETVRRHNLMNELLDGMVADPFGRRHIISLWQNQDFKDDTKGLKPCAFMTEWFIRNTKTPNLRMVDLELHQRKIDCAFIQ